MEKYRILSDSFAVPGLFCLFLGTLWWLAGKGAYRGLGYVMKNALCLLTFRERKPYEQKQSRGRASRPLLIAGVILLGISGVFAGLYCL